MTRMIRFFLALSLVLAITVGGSVGFAGKSKGSANVSGKVTYKGEVVPGGNIAFHRTLEEGGTPIEGQPGATVKKDGTYSAVGLPAEEYIVTMETESINQKGGASYAAKGPKASENKLDPDSYRKKMQAMGKGTQGEPPVYMKIPSKYADKKTSPLRVTLKRGDNTFDVELKDE